MLHLSKLKECHRVAEARRIIEGKGFATQFGEGRRGRYCLLIEGRGQTISITTDDLADLPTRALWEVSRYG